MDIENPAIVSNGTTWLGASAFTYAGSIGPLPLETSHGNQFEKIGQCLARRFHLRGLFGVDVVIQDDLVWPVEVNPRYTASIEVLERTTSANFLDWHVAACREGKLPDQAPVCSAGKWFGKAICFASGRRCNSSNVRA